MKRRQNTKREPDNTTYYYNGVKFQVVIDMAYKKSAAKRFRFVLFSTGEISGLYTSKREAIRFAETAIDQLSFDF